MPGHWPSRCWRKFAVESMVSSPRVQLCSSTWSTDGTPAAVVASVVAAEQWSKWHSSLSPVDSTAAVAVVVPEWAASQPGADATVEPAGFAAAAARTALDSAVVASCVVGWVVAAAASFVEFAAAVPLAAARPFDSNGCTAAADEQFASVAVGVVVGSAASPIIEKNVFKQFFFLINIKKLT